MDIKINASWFRFLEELPADEIKKIVHAIWDYAQGNQVENIKSAAWETIKASIDFETQHKKEISENRRKSANCRWHKTKELSEQSAPEIQTEVIEPEIIVPENKFITLTDNIDIRNSLFDSESGLNFFLATGSGYDELTVAEREFADRADVRALCPWHKEIKEPIKVVKQKRFTPPTIDEWLDFCREKNLNLEKMRNAYDGYVAADWHDTQGTPIRNWKQKILMVWAGRPDNYNTQTANFTKRKPSAYEEMCEASEMARKILQEKGII